MFARATHFKRPNHRMHNKHFITDEAMAITGGRNTLQWVALKGQGRPEELESEPDMDYLLRLQLLLLSPFVSEGSL
jgi:hypothetical protein